MELHEREAHYQRMMASMHREEAKFVSRLQNFMQTLLKRIQRDRDEQLQHRKNDSQILIQRNKNVLQDVIKRHALQSKRTVQFLKFALGTRSKDAGHLPNTSTITASMPSRLPSLF